MNGTGITSTSITNPQNQNVMGALCYVLGFVTGIVFIVMEKDNKFVKFHAWQSTATFLPLFIIGAILPWTMWMIAQLILLLEIVLWIVLVLKAYQGETYELPIVGQFAKQQANL